jgi:hypothetical protein
LAQGNATQTKAAPFRDRLDGEVALGDRDWHSRRIPVPAEFLREEAGEFELLDTLLCCGFINRHGVDFCWSVGPCGVIVVSATRVLRTLSVAVTSSLAAPFYVKGFGASNPGEQMSWGSRDCSSS